MRRSGAKATSGEATSIEAPTARRDATLRCNGLPVVASIFFPPYRRTDYPTPCRSPARIAGDRHGGHGMYVRNLTIPARIAGDRQVACPAWPVALPARTPARFAGGRRRERERSERVESRI